MRLFTIFIVLIIFSSCNSIVEGLNDNPNSPTSAPYSNILTGAEVGNIIFQTGETARRAGIFSGYYTGIQRQHQGFSNYTLTTSDFDDLWDDAYVNTFRNAKVTQEVATAEGISGVTIGISQVLQAMTIGTLTSLYGDVPFTEAGTFEIENPRFEAQSDVYNGVQDLLDEAITNLQAGTGRPEAGADIYFDGNPTAWIQVANTLKARFYMHTKLYSEAYAAAQSGIADPEFSLVSPHGTGTDESNLNYQFFAIQVRGSDVVTSDFMVSLTDPNSGTNPNPANYRGNAKTDETGRFNYLFESNSTGIQPNTLNGWAAQEASAPIVTYEENMLILAEAGARTQGFDIGLGHLNDYRAYLNGGGYMSNANASDILYEAYVAADFDNGGMENPDGVISDVALIREIVEERYITLFGQIEGFNDVRRTYNESVRVPVPPNTGNELPQRFIYPQSEIDRNSNTPDPIPSLFDVTPVNNN